MRSASVSPSTSSRTSARDAVGFLEAIDRRDVGMVERRQDFGFPLEPGKPIGVGGERLGRTLIATSRSSLVSRPVHLSHPPGADGRVDLDGPRRSPADRAMGVRKY